MLACISKYNCDRKVWIDRLKFLPLCLFITLSTWGHKVEILYIYWSNNSPPVVWKSDRLGQVLKGSETASSLCVVPREKEVSHLFSTNPKASSASNPGNPLSKDLPTYVTLHPGTSGVCFSLIKTITRLILKKAEPLWLLTLGITLKIFLRNFYPVVLYIKYISMYRLGITWKLISDKLVTA